MFGFVFFLQLWFAFCLYGAFVLHCESTYFLHVFSSVDLILFWFCVLVCID